MTEHRAGPLTLARAASAATPPSRDRVVDALRAGSLLVVVLGHVLMAYVTWDAGRPRLGNLLAELPALKILTWVLQVMPLFFAAGQIANAGSYAASRAAGSPWRVWYWGRVRRLARPALYYLAIWIPLALGLEAAMPRAAGPLARLSTQLLWFLGVYVLVVALTGPIGRLAARGWPSVAALLTVITLVDLGRFHITGGIGVINFLVVWVLAATLGPIVRARAGSPRLLLVALAALVANALVVRAGPYPLSRVGMPG
ncbi:MAG: acyltransferase family protein, partial [Actinomycetota bacterium]